MSDALVQRLERVFGAQHVSSGRARFDEPPVPLLAPARAEDFREALSLARSEGWCVVPTGLGSKLSWCAPPARVDFLLSTRAWSGTVAHEPGDGTLTARAGTTIAELATRAAGGGHTFTPDVPRPEHASLGGVIAAGQSGADRLRYGPVRDHVLGVEVALADGTRARSGGRLVKNVTGYDLQRLFTGSHGTLCVILEATLRLFPLAEDECVVQALVDDSAELVRRTSAALSLPVPLISLTGSRTAASTRGSGWLLAARLGGRREVVEDELSLLAKLWPSASVLRGDEARREAARLRDRGFGESDGPLLRAQLRPSAFPAALEILEGLLDSATTFRPDWILEPGLARIDVALRPEGAARAETSRLLAEARSALAPLGGRVQLLHAARELALDPGAPNVAGQALMRAIRSQLDPTGVFASGRFHAAG